VLGQNVGGHSPFARNAIEGSVTVRSRVEIERVENRFAKQVLDTKGVLKGDAIMRTVSGVIARK